MKLTIPITNREVPRRLHMKRTPGDRVHVIISDTTRERLTRITERAVEVCALRPSISNVINLALTVLDKWMKENPEFEERLLRKEIKAERSHHKPKQDKAQ